MEIEIFVESAAREREGGGERGREAGGTEAALTALLVLMSVLPLRYSNTFSKLPALAARRKLALPSVYNTQQQ